MIKKSVLLVISLLSVIILLFAFCVGWFVFDSWLCVLMLLLQGIMLLIIYSCARVASRISRMEEMEYGESHDEN